MQEGVRQSYEQICVVGDIELDVVDRPAAVDGIPCVVDDVANLLGRIDGEVVEHVKHEDLTEIDHVQKLQEWSLMVRPGCQIQNKQFCKQNTT